MAINKKLIHFLKLADFETKLANNEILDTSIVFIKDAKKIWTHGNYYDGSAVDLSNIEASILNILDTKLDNISDLETIRSGANKGATAVQPTAISDMETKTHTTATYATKVELNTAKTESQSYTDTAVANLVDSAPDTLNTLNELTTAITEHLEVTDALDAAITNKVDKVSGKGLSTNDYTTEEKNKLAGIATGATANTGTITGIKMNGASKGTSGVIDLGTVITAHQDISGKQDKNLYFTNKSASSWVSDSTYSDFPYRCDIACSGVTASMYAEVVFSLIDAQSGNYAPVCETKANIVSIWSNTNTAITIPTIKISK